MNYWRKCSSCKKEIPFGGIYQVCSISSCKRKSVFCSVTCWDVHNGVMGHKSAWAEEEQAPQEGSEERPRRRIVVSTGSSSTTAAAKNSIPRDILIVASKLKGYIKARSDMNTSGNVMEPLSDVVRTACDKAIEHARSEGRKTVMDRDFISETNS